MSNNLPNNSTQEPQDRYLSSFPSMKDAIHNREFLDALYSHFVVLVKYHYGDKDIRKVYKKGAELFWKRFNKVKAADPDEAKNILDRFQEYKGIKLDSDVIRKGTNSVIVNEDLSGKSGTLNVGWKRIRYISFIVFGRQCACCRTQDVNISYTIDHIIPKSIKPHLANDIRNLQVMCADCNQGKDNQDCTDHRTNDERIRAFTIHRFPSTLESFITDCLI